MAEFKGSAPEKMDFGPSDEKIEWENRHFTSNEVEKCGPRANDWKPKSKVGTVRQIYVPWLDEKAQASEAYRRNYDAIDWSKPLNGKAS